MTIQLELNKTYRTRDGKAEYKIDNLDQYGVAWAGGQGWVRTGLRANGNENPSDLVEEVITGPVRQRTTTRTEIVPGTYGRLSIARGGDPTALLVHVTPRHVPSAHTSVTADELDALAATAAQLAAALRQIATEQND